MGVVLSFVSAVFWGVIVFSLLVFVHEGGHFLAARACGVRVTEFFLGLPCRWRVYHESRRIGTRFGITPFLLGGYAAICGMEPEEAPHAAEVLACVHAHGTVSVPDMAQELEISEDAVLDACAQLLSWGSIAPVYDASKGEGPTSRYYPSTYAALPRDPTGNTIYDGRAFDREHATKQGEPWVTKRTARSVYCAERSHTYLGKGFWKRALMLVAGILVNILSGFLLLISVYSIVGVEMVSNANVLGGVEAESSAAEAGIEAGDAVVAVNGVTTDTWEDVLRQLAAVDTGSQAQTGSAGSAAAAPVITLTVEHDGKSRDVQLSPDDQGLIGISASLETVRLNPLDAARVSFAYVVATAQSVLRLITPAHTVETLQQSSSVVGISVMSAEAAQAGPASFLSLMALVSFSLGFMNLLPTPPLDGGKLLLEIIEAIWRRPVPLKVQMAINYVGIGLFGLLFIYLFGADILRLIS